MKTYTTPTGSFDNRDVGTSQRKQYNIKNPGDITIHVQRKIKIQKQNFRQMMKTFLYIPFPVTNILVSVASFEYNVYGFQSNGFLMFRISCSKLILLLIIVKYFIDITTIFRLTIPHRVCMYFTDVPVSEIRHHKGFVCSLF